MVPLVISDGGKLTTQGSVQSELNLPMHSSVPGSELTREPFRWDQRLYALVLRMAGTPPLSQDTGHVASDFSSIDAMCEVTGGRSYAVTSQRMLHQCIDSLVQKLHSGVVIHFEKIGPEPPPLALGKDHEDQDNSDSLSRADTIILDGKDDVTEFGSSIGKLTLDKVPFIYDVSTKHSYSTKLNLTTFFYFSTLHFDEIFVPQFEILSA